MGTSYTVGFVKNCTCYLQMPYLWLYGMVSENLTHVYPWKPLHFDCWQAETVENLQLGGCSSHQKALWHCFAVIDVNFACYLQNLCEEIKCAHSNFVNRKPFGLLKVILPLLPNIFLRVVRPYIRPQHQSWHQSCKPMESGATYEAGSHTR